MKTAVTIILIGFAIIMASIILVPDYKAPATLLVVGLALITIATIPSKTT